jgi:glutamate dehydrogenase (NADP+)
MINYASGGKESFSGKKVAISGSGNVAQYAALKVIELGGTVVSLSDSKGSIIAEEGASISAELISEIAAIKVARKSLSDIANTSEHKITYKEGVRPWKEVKVDVALPCATQNEVSGDEAEALVSSGAKFVAEGSNMGCTKDAIDVFEKTRKEKKDAGVWYGPGKLQFKPHLVKLC